MDTFFTVVALSISLINLINTVMNVIYSGKTRTVKLLQERLDQMHDKKEEYKRQYLNQLNINQELKGQLSAYTQIAGGTR